MQYFRIFNMLYVYGYRFNMNTKAETNLNKFFYKKKSVLNDTTNVHGLTV